MQVFGISLNSMRVTVPSIDSRTVLIPYYPGLGNGYSVKKFDLANGKSTLIVRWGMWLEEIKEKNENFEVKSIVGEFSNFDYEKMILDDQECSEKCDSIEIIFGDKIDTLTKEKIILGKYLPESGRGKLMLYQYSERPRKHKTLIDNKIFYEDEHNAGVDFKNFVVYENIPPDHKKSFLADFLNMKENSTPIFTISDLEGVASE
jgi:hypothetical protein